MTKLVREVQIARDLAKACGNIALELQQKGHAALRPVEKPNGEGTLTQGDIQLNQRICDTLEQEFPDDAILAEECPELSQRGRRRRCWFVDPIDGTRDYALGLASWAIHIGLADHGRPVFGLVCEPAQQRSCWATHDDPQLWREVSGTVQATSLPIQTDRDRWRAITSKNHRDSAIDLAIQKIGISNDRHQRSGSTGVKIATLARGEAEIYIHPVNKTKLWDTCAPQVILEAAGGTLTDVYGQPLRYDQPSHSHPWGLLATAGIRHQLIVETLSPLAKTWFQRQ